MANESDLRRLAAATLVAIPLAVSGDAADRPAPGADLGRSPVLATHGMIATSQPLASAAGLRVLQQGGNAVDAAVTAAAVLNVVEPMMCGIGGDLFALVYDAASGKLHALNATGRAGSLASAEALRGRGLSQIPPYDALAVTVPGALDGWHQLLSRFGTLSLAEALQPAIGYAEEGFPVSQIIATSWQEMEGSLARDPGAAATYLIDGRAPRHGEVFRSPDLARTFRAIAAEGPRVFYGGELGSEIAGFLEAEGGLVTLEDLAGHHSDWVEPISTSYRGYTVHQLPPNSQGFVALEMLNLVEGYDVAGLGHNSAAYLHLLIEAKKLAFADRAAYLADPEHTPHLERLISKEYAAERRALIDPERAARSVAPGLATGTDTVYLTAVDEDRNVVSLIYSIFHAFGSGRVVPGTGIVLQNRGAGFSLEPGHPNEIAPGKRALHTNMPGMVTKDGRPWLTYGVMGGDMQPQGHVQVLLNLIDFGMNVQEAGERPRFRHFASGVGLESGIDIEVRQRLVQMGHQPLTLVGAYGGYQAIRIDWDSGVLMAGSDPRKDGAAMGY